LTGEGLGSGRPLPGARRRGPLGLPVGQEEHAREFRLSDLGEDLADRPGEVGALDGFICILPR
jgi:hypothetical protein